MGTLAHVVHPRSRTGGGRGARRRSERRLHQLPVGSLERTCAGCGEPGRASRRARPAHAQPLPLRQHLLVALGDARPRLLDYTPAQRAAFWKLVDVAAAVVERALQPQGLNIGLNQGRAGGAGLPEHLHAHVLPRWSGDTNFMATVAGARVVPDSLESVAAAFRRVLPDALASVEANPDRS
ncbi:MAG: HIT domain-containing protein [Planctomycetes bacterium]|nr:HIT domain-containing protein [Planctomycetota bacterium]